MSKFNTRDFIENKFSQYGLLVVSVDYCVFRGRHEDGEIGRLKNLEVRVSDYHDYGSFFKAVKELMNEQEDAPANSADCFIRLSPVYKLSFYYNDKCDENWPQEHFFMKFSDKFYKYVDRLGLDCHDDSQEGCEEDDNFYVSVS